MNAPTPAQPSEGAVFCRLDAVPDDGWEVRDSLDSNHWLDTTNLLWERGCLVEARPKPEPTVTVEIPVRVAQRYAGTHGHYVDDYQAVSAACRKALEP